MNLASFLLCLVFAAIGYVAHPTLLPKLVDSKLVVKSSLSDSYKEELGEDLPISEDDEIEEVAPDAVKLEVVEQPIPVIPDPVTNPALEIPKVAVMVKLSEQELIDVLKSSVKAGDVNEFNFDQVVDWKLSGEDGVYQVGMVTYKADTIFDEQQLEAKALVKDGKVVKWLWPTTNTKMR